MFKAPLGDVTIVWDSNDGDGNQPRIDGTRTKNLVPPSI